MKIPPHLLILLLLAIPALRAHGGFSVTSTGLESEEGARDIQSITLTEEPSQGKTIVLKDPARIAAFVNLFITWIGNNGGLVRTYNTNNTALFRTLPAKAGLVPATASGGEPLQYFLRNHPACYVITIERMGQPSALLIEPHSAGQEIFTYTLYMTSREEKGTSYILPGLWLMNSEEKLNEYRVGQHRGRGDQVSPAEIALEQMFRQVKPGTTNE